MRPQVSHILYKVDMGNEGNKNVYSNRLLKMMGISDDENCLFCRDHLETIEHIYISCANTVRIWNDVVIWVRNIYDPHFIISDQEKFFDCSSKDQICQILITSVKDVIYQKRKSGTRMVNR